MKKSLIMLAIFMFVDLVAYIIIEVNASKWFATYFLPIMFLEIAIYGSVIIYDISKLNDKLK